LSGSRYFKPPALPEVTDLKVGEQNADLGDARGVFLMVGANHGHAQRLQIQEADVRLLRCHAIPGAQIGVNFFEAGLERRIDRRIVVQRVVLKLEFIVGAIVAQPPARKTIAASRDRLAGRFMAT
jgi:hypothetical protein